MLDRHTRKVAERRQRRCSSANGSDNQILLTLDPIAAMAEGEKAVLEPVIAQLFKSPSIGKILEELVGESTANLVLIHER
jgi:hypothetical protein